MDRGQRQGGRRLAAGAGAALLATGGALLIGPAPAHADEHDYLTVTGIDLAEPLVVSAEERPELYAALRREVSWLLGRDGDAPEPDPDLLGPQYTLVLAPDGEERHRFHLFPLAEGGPRVFRPAEQPGDRTVAEAWHFGRLSLPDTLRSAGVPLTGEPAPAPPAGRGAEDPDPSATPDLGLFGSVATWRENVLLATGAVVVIGLALGGVAFLVRRAV